MKIAHESPTSIFKEVQKLTDYDYCLVHLLEEDSNYLENFLSSKKEGREIILDNSIFELGVAFDSKSFSKWVEKLRPDWYIVPDVLENCYSTVLNYHSFIREYPDLPGKKIGVLQGKTYEQLLYCYVNLVDLGVDKIAISFDYSYYVDLYPNENKLVSWCEGRKMFIDKIIEDVRFDSSIPIHLLGCSLPQEFNHYRNNEIIESMDSSNPVVCGLYGIEYNGLQGLQEKPSKKLFELIREKVNEDSLSKVIKNILTFKKIVNGKTNINLRNSL